MQLVTKSIIALGFVGAMAFSIPTETRAQGIYFEGPGVEFGIGRPAYRDRYYRYDYDRPFVYRERSYGRDWDGRRYRGYRDWD